MNRQRLSLIIGAVLALFAVFLVRIYLNQQREAIRIQESRRTERLKESQSPILVAKVDIAPQTILEPSMFDVAIAPANQIPPQAVTSYDQILQKEAVAPIAKGEPILLTKLMEATRKKKTEGVVVSLSTATPAGKRAVTIPVDNIASVGGMVNPGDNVDVVCLLSVPEDTATQKKTAKREVILPLFQNILVLAVGSDIVGAVEEQVVDQKGKPVAPKEKASGAKTVTLALSPQEANIIAFVQEQGKIRLVLRSPQDSLIQKDVKPISWETLFKLLRQDEGGKDIKTEDFAPKDTIEIYRGMKREVIPLSGE
ncbi:MAG: Flp pilus assembly protein CpaB [Candidatus Omnitrophica bacterium]|nr:Flp pilus assembly protein CpaB [Candidatus Omnitrophota bacterium]HOX54308.1 Flp pilus assembly protein CpaB [Candidatus Omnitrophota bacterium]